ncbi:MAG: hypothetical protein V4732_13260 [Pseudomonadota bacterium]
MKNKLASLFISFCPCVLAESFNCPIYLPVDVEEKLRPVLLALGEAKKQNNYWFEPYENAFNTLISAKDESSKYARVALMDYYVGESYGESLVCAVALDGEGIKNHLNLYSKCDIKPKNIEFKRNHNSPLRGYAIEKLNAGNVLASCTYE